MALDTTRLCAGHLAEGETVILADADLRRPGFINGNRLGTQIARCRPDGIVASPSLLLRLQESSRPGGAFRKVFIGGAPVFPSTVERLGLLSESGRIVVVHGSTEAEPIAHQVCEPGCSCAHSTSGAGLPVGAPCDAVQVRILNGTGGQPTPELTTDDFAQRVVSVGQPGQIVVTVDYVVKGYVDGRGDANAKIRVKPALGNMVWQRTGDAGRADEYGQLWLLGRCIGRVTENAGTPRYQFEIEVPLREQLGLACAAPPPATGAVLAAADDNHSSTTPTQQKIERVIGVSLPIMRVPGLPMDRCHNAKSDDAELKRILNDAALMSVSVEHRIR
ncbi:MAG: AMP-binding protein [Planctomycetota bacterium]